MLSVLNMPKVTAPRFMPDDVVVIGNEVVTVKGSHTDTCTGTWYRVEDFNGKLRIVHENDVRPEVSGVWSTVPQAISDEEEGRNEFLAAKGWE